MKTLFRSVVAAAALTISGAALAAPRTATLEVQNVTCVTCAPIVKKTLSRISGVSQVSIIEHGGMATATVTFDDEKATAVALAQAVTNAGFPATVKDVKSAQSSAPLSTALAR
ncbi:MAG: cation transporter [Afipia sp.]|nr:cation transporter [Afipia sp.]